MLRFLDISFNKHYNVIVYYSYTLSLGNKQRDRSVGSFFCSFLSQESVTEDFILISDMLKEVPLAFSSTSSIWFRIMHFIGNMPSYG